MKRIFRFLLIVLFVLIVLYLLGPRVKFQQVNNKPLTLILDLSDIERYVQTKESKISNIKPDNHSQFIWFNKTQKTPYSILYLHGYGASKGECQPILSNFSQRYGCNAYLHRLALHGLDDDDAFEHLTPALLVNSAKEAVAIAKNIGEKLIIISTSTGATLATYLAANDPSIEALIMTAPNFDLHDKNSHLMLKPWGKQLLKKIVGGDYRQWETTSEAQKYWTTKNRIEGLITLRSLLDQTMTAQTFDKINIPVFVGYYYKDENNFDNIISVDAIQKFSEQIKTSSDQKIIMPFASARGHVISSMYMNKNWKDVQDAIFDFSDKVLKMPLHESPNMSSDIIE